MSTALITGASRGFGLALASALAGRGWKLVIDGRDGSSLQRAAASIGGDVIAISGDVSDAEHRRALMEAVDGLGGLDLLVNNASTLGPSPLPPLDRYPLDELEEVFRINSVAPLALMQALLPNLTSASGTVVNVTSDASVEPYEGWGGYGSSKAALDQLSAVFAVEHPSLRVYAFDPGDMRTAMHQDAYPGEDISDRAEPETIVPALMRLLEESHPSGRYRAADFLVGAEAGS
jgi:NAD(P)-dependent dehydrogenase (short-subunit alcohol dehydrogenase family)